MKDRVDRIVNLLNSYDLFEVDPVGSLYREQGGPSRIEVLYKNGTHKFGFFLDYATIESRSFEELVDLVLGMVKESKRIMKEVK